MATTSTRRRFLTTTGGSAVAVAIGAQLPSAPVSAEPPAATAEKIASGSEKRIVPGSPSKNYSRAVILDRLVFVAGCVGRYTRDGKDAMDPDFPAQARVTLDNLKASIEAAGSSMDRVLKCTCFLKEQGDFAKFNDIYNRYFPKDPPARSTVIVKDFVVPGALLEVDCECYVD